MSIRIPSETGSKASGKGREAFPLPGNDLNKKLDKSQGGKYHNECAYRRFKTLKHERKKEEE